ncbi:hypothetical protein PG995_006351 [Apiospora arundinis]
MLRHTVRIRPIAIPSRPRQQKAGLLYRVKLVDVAEDDDDRDAAERPLRVVPVLPQPVIYRRQRKAAHLANLVDDEHHLALPPL